SGIAGRCGGDNKVCDATDVGDDADDPLASIGWGDGMCPGLADGTCRTTVADCDEVGVCLACIGTASVERTIALYYRAFATGEFGTKSPVNKCQRAIGKEAAKYLQAKAKIMRSCWDKRLRGEHAEPCPEPGDGAAAALIAKAEATKVSRICKACGGADKTCGNGDDLAASAIGFASTCPSVQVPGGGTCGAPIVSVADVVTCVDCATDFAAACVDLLAVPQFAAY